MARPHITQRIKCKPTTGYCRPATFDRIHAQNFEGKTVPGYTPTYVDKPLRFRDSYVGADGRIYMGI